MKKAVHIHESDIARCDSVFHIESDVENFSLAGAGKADNERQCEWFDIVF